MRSIASIIFFLIIQAMSMSQPCLPDGITFTTQAQIDSFQVNYPNCTKIMGNVTISGSNITNLNGLNLITSFGHSVWIEDNDSLTSLIGLENLTSISNRFYILGNDLLQSLSGLEGLTHINGDLFIGYDNSPNPLLTNLMGLTNLTYIEGSLTIFNNTSLTSLIGLEGLSEIYGDLEITSNTHLTSLTGLNNIDTIRGELNIIFNSSLTSLQGLDSVSYIGDDVVVNYNDSLQNLAGLDKLTSIGDRLVIASNQSLLNLSGLEGLNEINGDLDIGWIGGNPSLNNLNALENLNSIDGFLRVKANSVLTSLSGLDNIGAESIEYIEIYGNPLLFQCEVLGICNYLTINDSAYITDNNIGCNSPDEIQDSCEANAVLVEERYILDNLSVSPNPFTTTTTLQYTLEKPSNVIIRIFNSQGQMVEMTEQEQPKGKHKVQWNASGLPAGMYYFRIQAGGKVGGGKMVKME